MHDGLHEALEEAATRTVRAVVITGADAASPPGQDLTAFGEAGDVASILRATYHVNIIVIRSLEKPVIAAVNGVCAGAGCRSRARATSGSRPTRRSSSRASSGSA